jgi:hypothetical protein
MKNGKPHRVPLPGRALEILRDRRGEFVRQSDYVFANPRGGPLTNMAMLALLARMGHSNVTVHGFRSSFRDWASECTDFPNEVVEMALAHTIKDATEAAYRRLDLFEKRRRLMDAWATYCEGPGRGEGHPAAQRVMPTGSLTLGEYPAAMVRLACGKCDRRGQYHKNRLIAEHGADVALPDLRHKLASGCPLVGHRATPCAIYYVDLGEESR